MKNETIDYFTKKQWFIYIFIIMLGLILRWASLDQRPYHHDESLYAIFGVYQYNDPFNLFYKYQPILHGPILFQLYPYVFDTFGVSHWSARMPMAFFGSLITILPFFFRHIFNPLSLIILTFFFSLSPNLIYWSRFINHDVLVVCTYAMMLFAFYFYHKEKNNFYLSEKFKNFILFFMFFFGLTLHFCIKENAYVTLSLIFGFLVYEFLLSKFKLIKGSPIISKFFNLILNKKFYFLFNLVIAFCFLYYCYIYSNGFIYGKGILDGLYRESLSYWINQHHIERIKGPFLFQFFFLTWYDFIFMICLFLYFVHFYFFKVSSIYKMLGLSSLVFGFFLFTLYKFFPQLPLLYQWWSFFKFKIPLDFFAPPILIIHSLVVTDYHLKKDEKLLSLFAYLFFASFFTYSYLGEKVPWLSIYIYLPGVIYLILYSQFEVQQPAAKKFLLYLKQRKFFPYFSWAVVIIIFIFNLRMSIITNFSRAGSNTELISQVHTTETFHQLALNIRQEIEVPSIGSEDIFYPKVLAIDESIWPLTWYFRNLSEFSFIKKNESWSDYQYVFTKIQRSMDLRESHQVLAVPFRSWWVPQYETMGWKEFFIYALHHYPWNKPGIMYVSFAKKKITNKI